MEDIKILLNLGLKLAKEERFAESVKELKRAINMDINDEIRKIVLFQIAVCLMQLERYEEAEGYLLKYLEISEELEIYDLLADVYSHTLTIQDKEQEKALVVYQKMHELDPENDLAMINMIILKSILKKDIGEKDCLEAAACMDRLIESKMMDGFAKSFKDLAYRSMLDLEVKLINADKALYYFDNYSASLSEEEKERDASYKNSLVNVFSQNLYAEHFSAERHIEMMNEIYRRFTPAHVNTFDLNCPCNGEINIGFLSSDLRLHPVGRFLFSLFKEKVINSGIRYFCYDTFTGDKSINDDDLTAKLKDLSDKFVDISQMDNDEAERLLLKDRIDILFDLNGVLNGSRRELVMRRLAPVQFTWLGWPSTSAILNADYCIVDRITDPVEYSQRFYTEKLVYMSKTFLCYPLIHDYENDPLLQIKEPPFKKNGYITFGSFANGLKLTDKTLRAWDKILKLKPNSRIAIRSMSENRNEISAKALKRKFINSGIDMSRIDFYKAVPLGEYLSHYNDVDIMLDTFPFCGATTTCDAFSMGVPVVSLFGERHHERVGLSMLTNVGLSDLAAGTVDEYVEKAVKLSEDTERLTALKMTLKDILFNSPLSDTLSFKKEFENVMREIYNKNCREDRKH